MHIWKMTMVDSKTGNRDLNDPVFLVLTTGGSTESEVIRQIADAKEMVRV